MYPFPRSLATVAIGLEVIAFVKFTQGNLERRSHEIGAKAIRAEERVPFTLPDAPERPLEAENITRMPAAAHVTPTVVGLNTFSGASAVTITV